MRTGLACLGLILIVGNAGSNAVERAVKEHVFNFWVRPGARADSRVVKVSRDTECGRSVATARVSRMPAISGDPVLLPSQAVELTPRGDVLRRWPIPIFQRVEALEGDRVVVVLSPVPEPRALAVLISTQGDIEERVVSWEVYGRKPIPCPLLEIDGFSRLACFEFSDLISKNKRVIAEVRPCN